jgi:hypothetical protein
MQIGSSHHFSTHELKVEVGFSDRPLSVGLLDVYIFDFFSRPASPIVSKAGTNHLYMNGNYI